MGYKRSRERNRRLKKLYDKTKNSYGCRAWYDEDKNRFIRYYCSNKSGYTKYLKRYSNKKIRKSRDVFKNGSYRKVFDYWWTLF